MKNLVLGMKREVIFFISKIINVDWKDVQIDRLKMVKEKFNIYTKSYQSSLFAAT